MRVVVLGSGVIGMSCAYYLARAGHEVTVIDRQPGPALEASFANAGEISPGYASPWAAPGIPVKALKWLLTKHAPLVLKLKPDIAMVRWMAQMLANCTNARYAVNKARMVRLAEYSRDCLDALRRDTAIAYDERMLGTLQLFRTQKQLEAVAGDIAVLEQFNVPYQILDRQGCVAAEPALAGVADRLIAGGLRLPHDETGDCQMFTTALAGICSGLGVTFRYGTTVEALETANGAVTGVATSAGIVAAEACVVALGSFSAPLLRRAGIRIPVYPVKGYSLTLPVVNDDAAPVSTVMDETYKVAITRLGNRIRVGGMAELSGYNLDLDERRRATLLLSVSELFPNGGDPARMTFWTGMRPMTPDGTPIIGPTPLRNLYTATGHGTLGWTMACGTGRVIADLVSGRRPDIDTADLGMQRYG